MKATIKEVADYMKHVGLQYMATIGLDGKPKVRPMQFMVLEDNKLWFCTNSQKAVYAELRQCPSIELCGSRLESDKIRTAWIRLSADVVFEENEQVKDYIIEKSPIVHELYKNAADRSIFKVFYLKNVLGQMSNLGHVKGLSDRQDFAKPVDFEF